MSPTRISFFLIAAIVISSCFLAPPVLADDSSQQVGEVELTLVDKAAIGYATFQSHNQKIVANRHGIFLTHLRTRNEAYTA